MFKISFKFDNDLTVSHTVCWVISFHIFLKVLHKSYFEFDAKILINETADMLFIIPYVQTFDICKHKIMAVKIDKWSQFTV